MEDMPSGIWCHDKSLGLFCKYTLGQYKSTNNEWGSTAISGVGALVETQMNQGHFLAGASIYTDNATTIKHCIMTSNTSTSADNRGYFVTTQIQTPYVSAFWDDIQAKFKKMENSTDAIIIKARNEVSPTLSYKRAVITWTSTSVFTSTDADFANVVGGEEIEVIVGKGAGATAHVSTISFATPTYTITLDEAIPNVSGSAEVVINNYQKLGSITDQNVTERILQILRDAPWVQFKVELRGTVTSPEFEELTASFRQSNF
jgi:hypothetical protein